VRRLVGAASVLVFIVLTGVSYSQRLEATPLPLPVFPALTILFITSGSITVAYIAARAYTKRGAPAMLLLGSGSLIFGSTSLVAALAAGQEGSNPATTIFIVGALLSSVSHLSCATSRYFHSTDRGGSGRVAILTVIAVLLLVASLSVVAFLGALPPFLIQGAGTTAIAKGLLATAIAAFGLSSLLIAVASSRTEILLWYSCALAMTAVGLVGVLLSDWIFETVVFWVGRIALCLGGAFLVLSVRSAEGAAPRPDLDVAELFKTAAMDEPKNHSAA
jgi:hypothetical protein